MDMKAGLFQQQTLKLQMTQELSQAIALLQYSTQELTAFLENKALENPFVQVDTPQMKVMDPRRDRLKKTRSHDKDQQNWIEQLGKESHTLWDYLQMQIMGESVDPLLASFLLYIDENGYLTQTKEELATKLHLGEEKVADCIRQIQELLPTGVGATNLGECLLLQLKKLPTRFALAEQIVEMHFDLLVEKKWKELAKQLQVDLSDIQAVFDLIQTLNPRPGAAFHVETSAYVIPDVLVTKKGDDLEVTIYDEWLPHVTFQQKEFEQFTLSQDPSVRKYLQEKQQDYHWILKSLEQRKETITKVALKIVEKQQAFFQKGPAWLGPLTMKEVAEEIGVHESTVSRAVREKYIQTPYGTFELRYFFTGSVATTSWEQTSSAQVKQELKRMIDLENKKKPLSDQELVDRLKEEGYVLSRRTVTKYREQLGIASSSKRKRYDKEN